MARTLLKKEIDNIKNQQERFKEQCKNLNDLIDSKSKENKCNEEYDLVKGCYNYMFYCTTIECLIQQIFLYTFDSDTYLQLFGFSKKPSDLIEPDQLKILLTEEWLKNNLINIDYNLIKQEYKGYNNVNGILANIDISKFIQFYSDIRLMRNRIAHNMIFNFNDLSYKNDTMIKLEVILIVLNLRIEYLSKNGQLVYN